MLYHPEIIFVAHVKIATKDSAQIVLQNIVYQFVAKCNMKKNEEKTKIYKELFFAFGVGILFACLMALNNTPVESLHSRRVQTKC